MVAPTPEGSFRKCPDGVMMQPTRSRRRGHRCRAVCLLALLACGAAGIGGAKATEGGGTTYALGVATINPGLEPTPPGFNFISYNTFFTASRFADSRGHDALAGFHAQLYVTAPRLDYTLPEGILPPNWHLGAQIIQPIFDTELYTRPPGRPGQKHSTFGLGDTTLVPMVAGYSGTSNVFGRFAMKLKINQAVPTGDYDVRQPLNKGRNYFSFGPQYGVQFFPTPNITFGTNVIWIYNWANPKTHYKSGQEFAAEPVAEYSPRPNLWIGVQGYLYRQLTADRIGNAEATDGHFGSAVAIGPQIRYTVPGVSIVGKWQHEMLVRNRPDGERFWLQALFHI